MLNLLGWIFFAVVLLVVGSIVHAAFGPAGLALAAVALVLAALWQFSNPPARR